MISGGLLAAGGTFSTSPHQKNVLLNISQSILTLHWPKRIGVIWYIKIGAKKMQPLATEVTAKATAELTAQIENELTIPTPASPDEIARAISSNIISVEGQV